jgi:glucose-1-phosphate adenylyltransferase
MEKTLAVILAGGKGARLDPLTRDRAKPAVPFGGNYRIIDFVLSNCLNSGLRRMLVLSQYKAMSLDRHINMGWKGFFCRELDEFIDVVPPQQRVDENWYQGTADAVYQNIYSIEKELPDRVLILAGDHIYKMDYREMIHSHIERDADVTIGALTVPIGDANEFGVMQIDTKERILGFQEKPTAPQSMPNDPTKALVSMGIYVFNKPLLIDLLCGDSKDETSLHDFGKNIIPSIIDTCRTFAYSFRDENRKAEAYWRDVGTIDAYYEANMDLISIDPRLNLYDRAWPVRTYQANLPPPKFVFGSNGLENRIGIALDSIVCAGSIVSGARVERSVIGPSVRVSSFATVSDSILFEGVHVGRHAKIRRAILDKNVIVPQGAEIGFDLELDRQRGFHVSGRGIVTVDKNADFKNRVC